MTKIMVLRDHTRPVKQLSFDLSGATLTASCTDGIIYVYSLSSEQPQLIHRVDGLINILDAGADSSTRATWHPDGRVFIVPSETNGK